MWHAHAFSTLDRSNRTSRTGSENVFVVHKYQHQPARGDAISVQTRTANNYKRSFSLPRNAKQSFIHSPTMELSKHPPHPSSIPNSQHGRQWMDHEQTVFLSCDSSKSSLSIVSCSSLCGRVIRGTSCLFCGNEIQWNAAGPAPKKKGEMPWFDIISCRRGFPKPPTIQQPPLDEWKRNYTMSHCQWQGCYSASPATSITIWQEEDVRVLVYTRLQR